MDKKAVYYGIISLFIVYTLIGRIAAILEVLILNVINNWIVYIGFIVILYALLMYLVFKWSKRIYKIKLWFIVVIFILPLLPINMLGDYSNYTNMADFIQVNNFFKQLFLMVFVGVMFYRYYKK